MTSDELVGYLGEKQMKAFVFNEYSDQMKSTFSPHRELGEDKPAYLFS